VVFVGKRICVVCDTVLREGKCKNDQVEKTRQEMPGWNLNPTPISEHLNLLISFNHMKQEDDGPKYTEVLQVL